MAASSPPAIPDYELLRLIGGGAYGDVWLARNILGQQRAVKIIHRGRFTDARPFEREFEGIRRFEPISRSHPSQLAILHVGKNDREDCFYYVMELADAAPLESTGAELESYVPRTLRLDLERSERVPATQVLALGLALAEALAHLHGHGLVHRDIKPSNIIFVDGRPKLADIGLVTDASDQCSIVGTEGYLPPEGPGTPAADVFALGKVLYETLTCLDRRQFPELPADLRHWPDASLAFELNTILVQACAADARQRYAGAGELLADLKHLGNGRSVKRQRAWRHTRRLAIRLATISALVATGWLVYSRFDASTVRPATAAVPGAETFETSGTTNHEAWTEVQKARFFQDQFKPEEMRDSVRSFERATVLDPNYVEAWTGLAYSLSLLPTVDGGPSRESYPRAEEAARKALQLEPENVDAIAVYAHVKHVYGFGVLEAERLLRQAHERHPNHVQVLMELSMCMSWLGRSDESVAYARRAHELAPTSANANRNLGHRLFDARRYEEAIDQFTRTLEVHKNHAQILNLMAFTYVQMGRTNEACQTYLKRNAAAGASKERLQQSQADFERVGLRAFSSCPSPDEPGDTQLNYPMQGTYECVRAGDYESAIRWAERAFEDPQDLVRIKTYPAWDVLRADPRFQELIRRFDRLAGLDGANERK